MTPAGLFHAMLHSPWFWTAEAAELAVLVAIFRLWPRLKKRREIERRVDEIADDLVSHLEAELAETPEKAARGAGL